MQTNLELMKCNFYLNYTAGFERYDHFMIFFFQILGAATHDLNVKCNLLSPQDHLFLQIGDDKTETGSNIEPSFKSMKTQFQIS